MIKELVYANRTCRRFHEDSAVSFETLAGLVDLARVTASAGNLQPLKYVVCCDSEKNARIFPNLGWAAYLSGWKGPAEGERPAAYIVILLDRNISANPGCDHGIAAQTILLGAREQGLAGAMIGAVNAKALKRLLVLPENLDILLVLAMGKPREEARLTELGPDGDIRYYRDADQVHFVPKRSLSDILIRY